MKVAGIDVHKKVLMVVVVDAMTPEEKPVRRRFVTMPSELYHLLTWLREQGVEGAVMESTAQSRKLSEPPTARESKLFKWQSALRIIPSLRLPKC
jgi:hypothetical protein